MPSILDRLRAGEANLETQRRILQNALLPDEDLMEAIPILVRQNDVLFQDAQTLLGDLNEATQIAYFENTDTPPEDLAFYLERFQLASEPKTSLLLNPMISAGSLKRVASTLAEQFLDLVVNNQVKILEEPEIVQALQANPALSITQEQKLDDYERLLLKDLVSPAEELENRSIKEIEQEAIEEAKDWVKTFGTDKVTKKELTPDPDEAESVLQQVSKMTVPQKVQAAIKGKREMRSTLVRDTNKLVCSAVIRSPRMTEAEAESYAALRNVQTDVLRLISMNREWMKSYKIVMILVKNPRTPIGVSTRLIRRVSRKDLRLLKMNRGIPEVLRVTARRMLKSGK
ncbi:MAG: hypothetical protein CSA81_06880 [Acidobacteria bacterium]|nr:MAG: hypothetical protein CSA81_06880 [Acidobacteriota bacterium]